MLATCSNAKFLIEARVAKCHLFSMSLKDWYAAAKNDTMILKILRTNYVKPPMYSIQKLLFYYICVIFDCLMI